MNRLGFVLPLVLSSFAACDSALDAPSSVTSAGLSPLAATSLQERICTALAQSTKKYAPTFYLLDPDGQRLHVGDARRCQAELAHGWEVPATGFALGNADVDRFACTASLDELPVAFHPDNLPGAWGMAVEDLMADCSEPSSSTY